MKKMDGAFRILEHALCEEYEKEHAVVVNNGTAALHVALAAIGVGEGDEVIVPDFTMAACGFAVSYTGAKVVTVDCDETLNIDVTKIEEKITDKTKAIMVAHIYGRRADMNAVRNIATKHNLFVVEDACEMVAGIGNADVTILSFYRNKIIHAEEGGAVLTNNGPLHDRMQYLKNMAFDKDHTYYHAEIGFNYRMPDSQAEMVLESLGKVEENREKRRMVEYWYKRHLGASFGDRDDVWVYDTTLNYHKDMFKFGARKFFTPLSLMPMWEQPAGSHALSYMNNVYLPVYPDFDEQKVQYICKNIQNILL